jgi:hypothetical protein
MAGSWLKMRHDLNDAPEIRRLARACGVTKDDVLGKLFRAWSWFDRHSHGGRVAEETLDLVDEIVGHSGFAQALVSVGWLAEDQAGIVIPNWDRHNSETAKQRALDAARKAAARDPDPVSGTMPDRPPDPCPAKTRTREDEKKTREELPPLPREGFAPEAWQRLRRAWNAGPGKPWKMLNPPPPAVDRLAEADWLEAYPAGIAKLAGVGFFKTPVSLRQFCSIDERKGRFLDRLLGGEFDDKTATKARGDFGDSPSPPKTWSGPEELARRAMLEKTRALKETA